MWMPGEVVALRGVYRGRLSHVQSAIIVQDQAEEVALAILPGAECRAPDGYIDGKHGASGSWDRWGAYQRGDWNMREYIWRTNRLLILLEPEKYYASLLFWLADTDEFLCYYINFQLPFRRTAIGFDTLDLELDLIVEPDYKWRWKDLEEYRKGMEDGILRAEWVQEIEAAKQEVFGKLAQRQYPLDGSWLDWHPDPGCIAPSLPRNWETI